MTIIRCCRRVCANFSVLLAIFAVAVVGLGPAHGAEPGQPTFNYINRTPTVTGWPNGKRGPNLLGPADKARFDEAYKAVVARDWPRARQYAGSVQHPTARKLIQWTYLIDKKTEPTFDELVSFIEVNPHWPNQETLLKKAEEALPDFMPPQQLIAWFAGQEPLTGEGKLRLGKAMIATGQVEYGTAWIRRGFIEHDYSTTRQREIFAAYKSYFDAQTIDKRLDRLLWTTQHTQAGWLKTYASKDKQRIADVRIALMRRASNAMTLASNLSATERKDAGVLFDEVRYLRRRGDDGAAQRTLTKLVQDRSVPYPEKWWTERNFQTRKALKEKDYQTAYDIASAHGLQRGGGFADGEFLAGWIALRFLNKPAKAYAHFETLNSGVGFPISLSRARYWMGRAAEAQGQLDTARQAYISATEFPYTFYGQLAAESHLLANSQLSLPIGDPVAVDPNGAFFQNELITAIYLINEIDGEKYMRSLAYHLANSDAKREELVVVAELMRRIGHEAIAVRVAKKTIQRHILLTDYLYPLMELPRYKGRGRAPEPALVLGLSRQESEFNPRAISRAGARGLMQLMPSTAKITANKHGLVYNRARLTQDPRYNMQLGMAHLGDLLDRFDGSYIMIIAAYNAGGGRVDQWVRDMGDPRLPHVDTIDWIEQIPFSETRNYVQRVIENAMVYRHRIANRPVNYIVSADINRTNASPPDISYAKATPSKPTPTAKAPPRQASVMGSGSDRENNNAASKTTPDQPKPPLAPVPAPVTEPIAQPPKLADTAPPKPATETEKVATVEAAPTPQTAPAARKPINETKAPAQTAAAEPNKLIAEEAKPTRQTGVSTDKDDDYLPSNTPVKPVAPEPQQATEPPPAPIQTPVNSAPVNSAPRPTTEPSSVVAETSKPSDDDYLPANTPVSTSPASGAGPTAELTNGPTEAPTSLGKPAEAPPGARAPETDINTDTSVQSADSAASPAETASMSAGKEPSNAQTATSTLAADDGDGADDDALPASWQIPLECARFVIVADGKSECVE